MTIMREECRMYEHPFPDNIGVCDIDIIRSREQRHWMINISTQYICRVTCSMPGTGQTSLHSMW